MTSAALATLANSQNTSLAPPPHRWTVRLKVRWFHFGSNATINEERRVDFVSRHGNVSFWEMRWNICLTEPANQHLSFSLKHGIALNRLHDQLRVEQTHLAKPEEVCTIVIGPSFMEFVNLR